MKQKAPIFNTILLSICFCILCTSIGYSNLIADEHKFIANRLKRFESRERLFKHSAVNHSLLSSSPLNIVKNDFLLNDDTSNGARQENPSITINRQGNIVITWTDFRDGNADIYCQRFDSQGILIGSNFRINQDAGMMWQGEPSISSDENGNFIIAWEDRRFYNSDVYVQKINCQGILIDTNFRANDNNGTSDQRNTSTIILPNKNFIIVWDDWRNDWGDIYGQLFDSFCNPISQNFRINDDIFGTNQYYPSVACDDSGNFVVTWMDGRQGNWDIYAQRYNYQGIALGSNFRVNDDAGITYQSDPKITSTRNGQFIIVWQDQRNGNDDIYCQRFDAQGNYLGINFKVNNDIGIVSQLMPDVSANNNNFTITWSDNRNGDYDIYAQIYNNAIPVGNNFKVNSDNTITDQSESSIKQNQSGEFWIVWKDYRNNHSDIYMQRYDSNGISIGNNIKVNDDSASSHQRCSWITQDGVGNYIVTWEDERNNHCDIYAVRFDSLGNFISPNFKVNDDATSAEQYYASVATNFNGDFIITWTDGRNTDFDIYAQRFSSTGFPNGSNFKVNNDTSQTSQWYPIASCDSLGNAIIVWIDYRDSNNDIYGQLYDYQANPLGTNFMINHPSTGSQLYPYVARNRNGNFVAVWMDDRNNNYDIYAQRFDVSGNFLGQNFKVNDDIGTSYQGYPTVALDLSGNFYIVWEDNRNGNTDIYLQRYSSNGTAIGSNIRVDDDNDGFSQYSPTITFDELGRSVVVWCDFRNNDDDPEIYCQAFNSNGLPIGNNRIINQPDLFPANNQWLIGQGVTANARRIGFAWIDNRRHRGWDIYAKIIDWNYFTGISEYLNKFIVSTNPLQIFPNPTTGKIFLSSNQPIIDDIQIFNSTGQKISVITNKEFIDKTRLQIDLSWLKPGVYFLHYNLSEKPEVKKIVFTGRKSVEH